jgi:cell division protein FtsB
VKKRKRERRRKSERIGVEVVALIVCLFVSARIGKSCVMGDCLVN